MNPFQRKQVCGIFLVAGEREICALPPLVGLKPRVKMRLSVERSL